jgi:acetylornithine deacetylase/succinyl-diaminopimelate desuccinylase-like protein
MRTATVAACIGLTALTAALAEAQQANAERAAFRVLYEEMVEIDSSPSTGSCTRVARMAEARLRAAGFGANDVHVVIPEGRPDDGNVVAVINAPGAMQKAVLLLAHIDVVDAKREDWDRNPFTLVEEDGFFYGRGAADDKSMAAVFLDLMMRLKQETTFRPSRGIILALTCGEETSNRVNGVEYLLQHRRHLVDAAFAINEGGGGMLSADGKPLALMVQAGEKVHHVYVLEVTNPGGHSSRPVPDNAIYRLSGALAKLSALAFPIQVTPVTRAFFEKMGPLVGGTIGAAMSAVATNPRDAMALATLAAEPTYNAKLRTTCVATQVEAGHAPNALPQRARAIISCRVMQGTSPEHVKETIEKAVADAHVTVSIERRRDGSNAPALTKEIMEPVEAAANALWPGIPIVPNMVSGATDGRFLMNAGIPTYGINGMFSKEGETNAHGLNEKIRVKSLYEGREFLERIVRAYVK